MKKQTFERWIERVEALVWQRLKVPLNEIQDVDDEALQSYWEAGMSPRLFVEKYASVHAQDDMEDFDLKLEI